MENKTQTAQSFSDKWHKNRKLAFDETLREGSEILSWILSRNGLKGTRGLEEWLSSRKRILDAGCGNGRVTALLRRYAPLETPITGIDLTAADVAADNLTGQDNVNFEQRDLLGDLSGLGTFDLIYCQEVLHHTSAPKTAFKNLLTVLAVGGELAIYVYKKKAPLREYCDDFIRGCISELPYEDAMLSMKQITDLGKALSKLDVTVDVPDVQVLGIDAGTYDIQRFIYHFFTKCFWNSDLDYESNAAINYDWYHPILCSRHTLEEVKGWFEEENLQVIHTHVDPYGITVRGIRKN